GHADERHLWPAFYDLIAECRPPVVLGEQVASKDGREWLAGVRADLEALGYAVGAADLCAACVGAPHIRQRLWWVANGACLQCNGITNHISSREFSNRSVPKSGNRDSASSRQPCYWEMGKPPVPIVADGIPGLMGAVSAYGNTIVPWLAAEFVKTVMETVR
ncbi:hypothetical protein LCGC14_2960470, partial [marine sediment metagenome]